MKSSSKLLCSVLFTLLTLNRFYFSVHCDSVTSKNEYFHKIILSPGSHSESDKETQPDSDPIQDVAKEEYKFDPNFIELYDNGVQAYLENDWEVCINHFERSLNLYRQYVEATANCRVQCEFERVKFKNTHEEDYEHIHFYEKLIVKTLCLEKCRQQKLPHLPRYFTLDDHMKEIFKSRKPYEYLQVCYYQEGKIDQAISATYTVLVANPGDEVMRKNIQYYADQKDFDWDKMKDLEDKRYSSLYLDGVDQYDRKEWKEAIELLEIAMDLWHQEHDKCRALCENEFDQGWSPDFTTSVANHYVSTLRCKENCTVELSFINGRFYEDLYPSMYNYLQFSYYSAGNFEEANRCATSYLLFYPTGEDMLNNAAYYKSKYTGSSKEFLKPRVEAQRFVQRATYETELLNFVDNEFSKLAKEPFRPEPQMDHLTDRQIDDTADISNVITENEVK